MRIAIFASGAGSNAKNLIKAADKGKKNKISYEVAMVVCNKPGAGVIDVANEHGIPVLMLEKEKFFRGDGYTGELRAAGIELIVLAGFLWKLPAVLIRAYPRKIINIHPALLPRYGGKGMYGMHVHESVITNKDKESGITIHFVDELYDHGQPILQVKCTVEESDTPESLAKKIHGLEYRHFPPTVALLASL
jgi:phosphoribosylglycinamide formyltransferase-1